MPNVFHYYNRFEGVRGNFGMLPPWARSILAVFALPGILLAFLSLLLFMVSILALLLLTLPVYRLLQVVTGGGGRATNPEPISDLFPRDESPGRKQVDVRVVE